MEEITELSHIEQLEIENRKLKAELADYKLYKIADKQVLTWLAENIDINTEQGGKASIDEIQDMLRNQIAVSYLLIWPIFERRHFGGFMQQEKIPKAADILKDHYDRALKADLDPIIEKFFKRYNIYSNRNNQFYRGLQPNTKHTNSTFKMICSKRFFINLTSWEKIFLLLYVIYRYRNNIFHGSKNIDKWSKFTDQINDCLSGMMILANYMKTNDINIVSEYKVRGKKSF